MVDDIFVDIIWYDWYNWYRKWVPTISWLSSPPSDTKQGFLHFHGARNQATKWIAYSVLFAIVSCDQICTRHEHHFDGTRNRWAQFLHQPQASFWRKKASEISTIFSFKHILHQKAGRLLMYLFVLFWCHPLVLTVSAKRDIPNYLSYHRWGYKMIFFW